MRPNPFQSTKFPENPHQIQSNPWMNPTLGYPLFFLFRLTPADVKISAIIPGPGVTDGMALVIEAIITFNLMFVGLVVSDPRKPSVLSSAVTGFSIGTGALAAVSITSHQS